MKNFVRTGAIALLTLVGAFTATALAANAAAPEDGSWLDLLKPVWDAFANGKKLYAGSLAVFAIVALARRYAPGKVGEWLHGEIGSPLTTLVLSFAGTMAASLADGSDISLAMVKSAAMIAAGAAGGYALIKKLIVEPILKPLAEKAPAWLKPAFALVFWFFDQKSPTEKAEAAGEAAVAAKPAEGRGKITEID